MRLEPGAAKLWHMGVADARMSIAALDSCEPVDNFSPAIAEGVNTLGQTSEQTPRWRFWAALLSGMVVGYVVLMLVYFWLR